MKRVQVNEILVDQVKRRTVIANYIFFIIVLLVIASFFIFLFINNNRTHYITYNENSDLDYKVYLKQNNYFEDKYLGKGKQYIASLINNIDANFSYNFDVLEEGINYQYSYRIESDVEVLDSSTKNILFNKSQNIVKKQIYTTDSSKNINILDTVKIDYNYYNSLIRNFISDYDLDSYESNLKISMYVDVFGTCDEVIRGNNKEAVITLNIPLTTKTVAVDIGSDVTEVNNNSIVCKISGNNYMYALIISIVSVIIIIILFYSMTKYILKTRTPDDIYQSELKKILNRYHSYIQNVSRFDLRGYQLITVHNFEDLLEVRDCYQAPILMVEDRINKRKNVAFYVPTTTKMMYIYSIKVKK